MWTSKTVLIYSSMLRTSLLVQSTVARFVRLYHACPPQSKHHTAGREPHRPRVKLLISKVVSDSLSMHTSLLRHHCCRYLQRSATFPHLNAPLMIFNVDRICWCHNALTSIMHSSMLKSRLGSKSSLGICDLDTKSLCLRDDLNSLLR